MNEADLVASWHLLKLAEQGRPNETVAQFLASMWLTGESALYDVMRDLSEIHERVHELLENDNLVWIALLPGGGQGLEKLYELDARFEQPRFEEKLKKASEIGKQHGKHAASWYFNSAEPSREDYMRVLRGIEDVDPEIMDTFPTNPLSGEMAGSYSLSDLADEVEIDAGDDGFNEICAAYDDAFHSAVQDAIEEECRSGLKRTVEFFIRATLDVQDQDELLQKMEEVVNIADAELDHSETTDIEGS